MKWPSPYRDRPASVDLQLTPLIDCVFLLMIYFLWSSGFVVAEQTLPGTLSLERGSGSAEAAHPPPPEADFAPLVVRVAQTASGAAWQFNGAEVASLAQLRGMLASVAAVKSDAPVVIDPDPAAPLGDVIDVLDASRGVGLSNVRFAAEF